MHCKRIIEKLASVLMVGYIKLVDKTSKVNISNPQLLPNTFFGFWHGDSFTMNLLLKNLIYNGLSVYVIVTADTRGNFVERTIGAFGAKSIRVGDGFRAKDSLRAVYEKCESPENVLAVALDGPTGPYRKPKSISFKLAERYGRTLCLVTVDYSTAITVNNRWDKLKIPLPFTKISINIEQKQPSNIY